MRVHYLYLSTTLMVLSMARVNGHIDSDGYETYTKSSSRTVINSFKLFEEQVSWDDAKKKCESEDADLVDDRKEERKRPNFSAQLVFLFLSMTLSRCHMDSSGYETYTDKYGAVINSFKMHTKELVWLEANAKCISEKAHLIIPNSESEVRVLEGLSKMLPQWKSDIELHVGFTNNGIKEDWRSVLGGPMNDAWKELWRKGEPSYHTDENCVSMDMSQMKYLDVQCNASTNARTFVCEKEIIDQEAPEIDERIRV